MDFITYDAFDLPDHDIKASWALIELIKAFNHEITGNTKMVDLCLNEAGRAVGITQLAKLAVSTQETYRLAFAAEYAYNYECELHANQVLFHIRAKRQMRTWENQVVKGYGYTKWEMECAFNQVANPTDWKAPIRNRIVPGHLLDVTLAAITFFTATEATAVKFQWSNWYAVTSIGYRAGPAGDH